MEGFRYTMPQKFMEDGSVPVKWRLYGIINGFWIGGKTVYATNHFFSEQLQCTERHISRALEELEKDGLLTRNVNGFKRLILPGGVTPDVRGGRHGASIQHDVGRHHISDSISDSIPTSVANAPLLVREVEEISEKKKNPKKYPHSKEVFALWGSYPKNWLLNTTQLRAAENLFEEQGLEEIQNALEWIHKLKDKDFFPQISSPYDLDSKWAKLETFVEKL